MLGQEKLFQCSCWVLGGILWCECLWLAVAELPPPRAAVLAAGQRGRVALRARAQALVAQHLLMQMAAEEEQGSQQGPCRQEGTRMCRAGLLG